MRTTKKIRRFVDASLLDGEPTRGDPLTEGLLDSLAIEQLIAFLEDTFGLAFDDEELQPENFSSIDAVAALVDAKRSSAR